MVNYNNRNTIKLSYAKSHIAHGRHLGNFVRALGKIPGVGCQTGQDFPSLFPAIGLKDDLEHQMHRPALAGIGRPHP